MNSPGKHARIAAFCLMAVWAAASQAALWFAPVTISQIIVANAGGAYIHIFVAEPLQNPGNCGSLDGYVLRDPAILSHATAIALAAHASGKPVRLWVTDTCDAATGRPLVASIGVM
jgi:hypothetical protein